VSASEETIALLTRIAVAVEKSAAILERMEKRNAAKAPKEVASDQELDSKYGDPEIKLRKVPRGWDGELITGCHMSECPPEYLDCLAELFDWQAAKADEKNEMTESGKPISAYRRKDAARCRGWAKRLRAGWKQPETTADEAPPEDNNTSDFESDTSGGGW
jgi:hypothetical protein